MMTIRVTSYISEKIAPSAELQENLPKANVKVET